MDRKQFNQETEYHGHYPAVLTTDGNHYNIEYRASHDGWHADNTIISSLSCSDDLPSYTECERRRRAVKQGTFESYMEQCHNY
jgi:hypothetical protein